MSQTNPTPKESTHAEFVAKWDHHVREDGYCACEVLELNIDADNHSFFHLLEYLVENLVGMDDVILVMADKIVKEKSLKGGDDVTKN